ncbi:radical SAM family heme chaperone HemW [Rhabdochlamydiaceae symbiont of Dictyostelium giganteum]|uniref:radical SAM family heme chaperone HemW n=1 Tax=Rhabdochlamydiaceae symbiont of Dictyostelium giganteum TaxID=3342349 RepID=UPI00384C26B8
MEEISLYFHIPFCTKKCPYCHFFVVPNNIGSHSDLLEGLKTEWELISPLIENKKIVSIYFGGGTPFLIGSAAIQTILSWIKPSHPVEITLEANPDDITLEAMQDFYEAGINRVSIGIQSLDNPLLKTLGRIHTAQKATESVLLTHQAGIHNITVDLMFDLPGQTLSSWKSTLREVSTLPITHLSLYNLTFEPGAVFYKKQKELSPLLPSEEVSLEMLSLATTSLEKMGLKRYEISAFAKPSFESLHNVGYWTGRSFLGLGPSAFSYWEGKRFQNVCHLKKYTSSLKEKKLPRDFEEKLTPQASLHERFAIHLRLFRGVPRHLYHIQGDLLTRLEKKGWITLSPDTICLTDEGKLFYDSVAEEIVILNSP